MAEIVTSQTPPALQGPTEKEKKYDRQLRLWAASGQSALESSNLLLVNSGAGTVGVETLKNLVLPGIGKFTIYDNAIIQEPDLGVNFFVDESYLGKFRSWACTSLLQELNPEVKGDWFPKAEKPMDLGQFLTSSPTFTLILYAMPITQEDLAILEAYGREHNVPLISIHSAGFYSYFRISLPGTFPIVDTHPDVEKTADLRLTQPWPELLEFAREMTTNIDRLDNHAHGHLPYVVILLYYLEKWKESHDMAYPTAYKDKTAFRQMVAEGARTNNPEGGEENFDEAVAAVNRNVKVVQLETSLKEVFDHEPSTDFEKRSSFWMIAGAIKSFYQKHGCLPLPGGLPDMKAESNVYVKLQNIYKAKARKDAKEVLETVKTSPGGDLIDPAEVDMFCKNASFVKLVNGTSGNSDLGKIYEDEKQKDEMAEVAMMPRSLFPIYLALSATSHNPTATAEEIVASISATVPGVADDMRVLHIAKEIARAAGGELHNLSALTGGLVAQETIKIITKQYVPVDNTCIFDGIGSRCQVLRL